MELVADRFVVGDQQAIDLATGDGVAIFVSTAGGVSEQRQWAMRCDWFFSVRHHQIARLVDFGVFGEMRRFEAWRCGGPWRGSRQEAEAVRIRVYSFMTANGLTIGARGIHVHSGRPVVIPDVDAGYPGGEAEPTARLELDACGMRVIERSSVRAIAEMFDEASRAQRLVVVSAPVGSGLTTAIAELSRAARLAGFIPLSLSVDRPAVRDLIQRRSLFLIAQRIESERARSGLIEWALHSPKPHVLLVAEAASAAAASGLRLERLDAQALRGALVPSELSPADRRRVAHAARRARGLPGRFSALLWGDTSPAEYVFGEKRSGPGDGRSSGASLAIAAERRRTYGDETPEDSTPVETGSWPAPGELSALRRKMDRGVAELAAGRHAPGERALRSVTAGLARRRDWRYAMAGAVALSSSLLRRGRAREAQQALEEASEYGRKGGHDRELIDVAILAGTAWLDLGRLDEAESVLSAAVTAAESAGDPGRTGSSRLGLARCLFWRGRYEDAYRMLSGIESSEVSPGIAVRHGVACSRVAIGRNDLETAMARAASALEAAERTRDPSLLAIAGCGMALAHLAIGDRSAVERDVAASIVAARSARDPLRALRARLVGAESARRVGQTGDASALVGRVGRFPVTSLPTTVRARVALLADLVSGREKNRKPIADVVRRHVAASGLPGLALYAPSGRGSLQDAHAATRDVVDLVRLCQSTDEDRTVLARICALVRERVCAAAVAFFISDRGVPVPIAIDGSSRLEPEIAKRAIAAGQLIAPSVCHHHLEAGAPVRCGGDTHGALVVRWALGSSPDLGHASMLLTAAAAAAAPAMAGVVARRTDGRVQVLGELVGPSAAMEGVRRSVERAAVAPFAVLIEGESGCGKELVARALHRRSPRRDRPFCTLNCAALPDDLVESELFGHARGAFTGAMVERPGVFEEAHTGTLFLDEIGELSLRAQAKVLRTIQDGELRRVGENISRRVDVRIVSATNRELRQEVSAGRFRHDLLYRLDVIRIVIPPLRERREDIAPLIERFWREAIERVGSRAALGVATVAALARYDWPGNVRELQNVLAALAVRGPRRGLIPPHALPAQVGVSAPNPSCRLDDARRTFEQHFVRAALVRTGGHRERAAEELGVSRQGLTKLMSRLGIVE